MSDQGGRPTTEFTGDKGEAKTGYMIRRSDKGLQPYETVTMDGNLDLSTIMIGNGGACVYSIELNRSSSVVWEFVIDVVAQGPSGMFSGSMYLAFRDQSDDVYYLSIFRSHRASHVLQYNSDKPAITTIYWSDQALPSANDLKR